MFYNFNFAFLFKQSNKMTKFYPISITDVTRETAESVSIGFLIPNDLKEKFQYKQGQYLTLKLHVNGQELRRSYSICTSPNTDSELRVAIKKVKEGRVSTFINEHVKAGDTIDVMPPMGNFYSEMNPSNKKTYVLFAGGSGITPMLSILKTALHAEPLSKVILFYGNQNEDAIIFKNKIDALESQFSDKLKVYHVLEHGNVTDPLFKGIMTLEKTTELVKRFVNHSEQNEYFICGPTGMMQNIEQTLNNLNINKSSVHLEYFSAPVDTSEIVSKASANNETFKSMVTIICDGDEKTVELGADDFILDKALDANLDAPYACRSGSCCTCRAKLIEGKVEMVVNYALLDSEVEEGFILTCQSRPLTPVVVINYDQGR